MIEKIVINNFKGIKQGILKNFGKFNVIVGPNNSGKTTILELLSLSTLSGARKAVELPEVEEVWHVLKGGHKDVFAVSPDSGFEIPEILIPDYFDEQHALLENHYYFYSTFQKHIHEEKVGKPTDKYAMWAVKYNSLYSFPRISAFVKTSYKINCIDAYSSLRHTILKDIMPNRYCGDGIQHIGYAMKEFTRMFDIANTRAEKHLLFLWDYPEAFVSPAFLTKALEFMTQVVVGKEWKLPYDEQWDLQIFIATQSMEILTWLAMLAESNHPITNDLRVYNLTVKNGIINTEIFIGKDISNKIHSSYRRFLS